MTDDTETVLDVELGDEGYTEVSRRDMLKVAGLSVGTALFSGAGITGLSDEAAAEDSTETTYYVGTSVPSDPSENEFFYAINDGPNVHSGDTFYYNGSEWQVWKQGKSVWDVRSRMNAGDASGTTVTADDAFSAAISNARPGDTILFRNGTYDLETTHLIEKPVTIKGTGDATIVNHVSDGNLIEFRGGGTTGNTTTLSTSVDAGRRRIGVDSASNLNASRGDTVMIRNDEYDTLVQTPVQYATIQETSSGEVVLDGATYRDFNAGTNGGQIEVVEMLEGPQIENLVIRPADGVTPDRHLTVRWAEDVVLKQVRIEDAFNPSLMVRDCWKVHYDNCEARGASGVDANQGEHFYVSRSGDVYIESPRIYHARRGIDITEGSYNIDIVDPVIQGFTLHGISVHGNDQETGPISIRGGKIVSREFEDNSGVADKGNCITLADSSTKFISDCTLVSANVAIKAYDDMVVENVEIKPAAETSGGSLGIEINDASDVQMRGVRIRDPNGKFETAVRVESSNTAMSNIDLDLDIEKADDYATLVVTTSGSPSDTIKDLRIRGRIDARESGARGVILAPQEAIIENVDVSLDMRNITDYGVRLYENGVQGLRVHDSLYDGSMKLVEVSGGTTITDEHRKLKFSNCSIVGADEGFDFSGNEIDGLWIVNCDIDANTAVTGDGGVTNFVHYHGNRPQLTEP